MKNLTVQFNNTKDALKQLRRLPPSEVTLRYLDAVCISIGTSRYQVGNEMNPRLAPTVVRWAFLEGKSDRAVEIRKLIISELKKRAKEDNVEIPDDIIEAVPATCPNCTQN
jgi:hypothetical protein